MNNTVTYLPAGPAPATYQEQFETASAKARVKRNTAPRISGRAKPENQKFANDGSFESVEKMLRKMTVACTARVEKIGLPMTGEDVWQELQLAYLHAKSKWTPDGGSLFSTYCTIVCNNNFNQAIKKMARERTEMGMVTESEMAQGGDDSEENWQSYEMMAGQILDEGSTGPDMRLQRVAQLRANLDGLSINARRLIAQLLQAERGEYQPGEEPMKLSQMAEQAQLTGDDLKQVKKEIAKRFGVRWN